MTKMFVDVIDKNASNNDIDKRLSLVTIQKNNGEILAIILLPKPSCFERLVDFIKGAFLFCLPIFTFWVGTLI
jgi:hypothetical protein